MCRRAAGLAVIPLVWLSSLAVTPPASAEGEGVVRAVLFSSPTCPHCRKVREEVFPRLWDRFGARFQVAVLSTATPAGRDLYWAAHRRYGVKQRGVPLLVVGDFALVGSDEIPQRLPTLISSYLASGGVDWPSLPGLDTVLAASNPAPAPIPVPTPTPTPVAPAEAAVAGPPAAGGTAPLPPPVAEPTPAVARPVAPEAKAAPTVETPAAAVRADGDTTPPRPAKVAVAARPKPAPSPTPAALSALEPAPPETTVVEPTLPPAQPTAPPMLIAEGADDEAHGVVARVLTDPRGNGLAILVLVGMVATVLRSAAVLRRPARAGSLDWLTPLLGLAGLGVAAYLAHVEVRGVQAVCGPVGDCNTVQQSEYARLFGVLPIGVLGLLGFAAILVGWAVRRWGAGRASSWAAIALLAMTGFGTLFSIYLTFLEPFVIGATCLWCLSSAVIMTTLYVLAHAPGRVAAAELGLRRSSDAKRRAT
jgi:uncharacterized membrane protein/glutaredoxin